MQYMQKIELVSQICQIKLISSYFTLNFIVYSNNSICIQLSGFFKLNISKYLKVNTVE